MTSRNDDFDDFDVIEAEAEHKPYVFKYQERQWSMAHIQTLDSHDLKTVTAGQGQGGHEVGLAIIEIALGPEQWGEFCELPLPSHIMNTIIERYYKHCGISVGKSRRSAR
jgi:hypothetical protein